MDNLTPLLSNLATLLSNLPPETFIAAAVLFVVLALVWWQTGRFAVIGFIVRLLWLPINLLTFTLWMVAIVMNRVFDTIRNVGFLNRAITIVLTLACIWSYFEAPALLYGLVPFTLLLFYFISFGIDEQRLRYAIFYLPKPKRLLQKSIRTPKEGRAEKSTKSANKKGQASEKIPVVAIVAKTSKNYENEAEIIQQLDPHLRQLMRIEDE